MFEVGQRVFWYADPTCIGTVEQVTADYVTVHWDGNVTQNLLPIQIRPL